MEQRTHDAVNVHGHRIAYSTVGEGPPLLLIPGNSMNSERWVECGYVDALSPQHQLILVDPLGHGESDKVADRAAYTRAHLTDHLLAVLDRLELERVAAWGYSRGAHMLGTAVCAEPHRFTRAVLGGIPLFDADAALRELGVARDDAEYEDAFTRSATGDWAAFWSVFPLPLPDETKRSMEARNDVRAITAATWAARLEPFVFELSAVPTLAYWGDDEVFHALNVESAATLPIETAIVAGGHAEAFADATAAIGVVGPFVSDRPPKT